MAQQQQLEQLESEAIAIWEYLIAAVSTPAQLERLYLKVLVYLVAYFVNQASAIADTAKPAIFGGTATAYRTQVLKISPDIVDASIVNTTANNIVISLLSSTGAPSTVLLNLVQSTMQADSNRLICDIITVQPATQQNYTIAVSLFLNATASDTATIASVTALLNTYASTKQMSLGADIIVSDIVDIVRNLTVVGDVIVLSPTTNIAVPPQNYAKCTAVTVTIGGRIN